MAMQHPARIDSNVRYRAASLARANAGRYRCYSPRKDNP